MASRWIVDVDGRGLCAVAMEEGGVCSLEFGPAPREQCERKLQRLRERAVTRTRKSRVESGRALAHRNRLAREAAATGETEEDAAFESWRTRHGQGGTLSARQAPAAPQQSPEPPPVKPKAPTPSQKKSLDMYAQGFYREPCRICGKGIERSGARGRAPTKHKGVCP